MTRRVAHLLVIATFMTGAAIGSGSASGSTTFDDNQVPIGNHAEAGSLHLFSDDSLEDENIDPPSMLTVDQNFVPGQPFCSGPADANCTGKSMWFVAHLPTCSTANETDCIESVSATTASGTAPGSFDRYFPNLGPHSYVGDPALNLPTGRAPGVWKIPGAPHAAGDLYMVVARLRGSTSRRAAAAFQMVLTPVSLKTNADQSPTYEMARWTEPGRLTGPASDRGAFRCAYWGEAGACMLSHAFPGNTTFTVKVRLLAEPSGWLHGRVNDPSITFTKNGANTDVSVTASPVQVPAFQVAQQHSAYSDTIRTAFAPNGPYGEGGSRQPGGQYRTDLGQRNAEYNFRSYKNEAFAQFALVKDLIEDKADYAPWIWRVRTLDQNEMAKAGSCISSGSGVKGIVTTNAMIYGSGPPAYNSETKTLDYKVAAPHLTRTGEEFTGAYHLHMRSDVARCFYGFTDAPVTGLVSVVKEDGAPGTAVTNVSESDGWLKVSATGFTHSAPTVKVGLSQKISTRVKRNRTVTGTALAKTARLKVPRGAKVTISVPKRHTKTCRVSGSSLRALKKGLCTATVTVASKGKKSRTTVTITVT